MYNYEKMFLRAISPHSTSVCFLFQAPLCTMCMNFAAGVVNPQISHTNSSAGCDCDVVPVHLLWPRDITHCRFRCENPHIVYCILGGNYLTRGITHRAAQIDLSFVYVYVLRSPPPFDRRALMWPWILCVYFVRLEFSDFMLVFGNVRRARAYLFP